MQLCLKLYNAEKTHHFYGSLIMIFKYCRHTENFFPMGFSLLWFSFRLFARLDEGAYSVLWYVYLIYIPVSTQFSSVTNDNSITSYS